MDQIVQRDFFFTGGEIVNEFLVSTGYLPDAHDQDCPVYWQITRLQPAWTRGLRNVKLSEHGDEPSHPE